MDKMLVSGDQEVTVTNDGATILEKMEVWLKHDVRVRAYTFLCGCACVQNIYVCAGSVCLYAHARVCAIVCACVCVYMRMRVCVRVRLYAHACMYACLYAHVCIDSACACVCLYACGCV